jgi:ATP-dependent Clp protease ATP-binding subunit ClpA
MIELTAGEEELLRLSDIEADQLNDPFLGTEHILLAILRLNDRAANRFAENGMSLEKYREGMASSRRGDPPPSQPRAV